MKITNEEQEILYQLRSNASSASAAAELAMLRQRNSSLEYENALLKIYLKYKLDSSDQINEATGEISKKTQTENNQESEKYEEDTDQSLDRPSELG